MTSDHPTLWTQIWAAAPQLSGIIAAITVVLAVLTWSLGGVRPQSQIELDALKAEVVKAQSRLAVIESRIEALPRAQDYADWTAHLSRLDAVFEAQRDKLTAATYDIKDVQNRVQTLSSAPVQSPPSRR